MATSEGIDPVTGRTIEEEMARSRRREELARTIADADQKIELKQSRFIAACYAMQGLLSRGAIDDQETADRAVYMASMLVSTHNRRPL